MANFEIMQATDVWRCPDTPEHWWTEEDDVHEPLYECEDHGVFSRRQTEQGNHQCPECNKFGAKISEYSCPEECEEEMESLVAYQIDGEGPYYVSLDDVKGEG